MHRERKHREGQQGPESGHVVIENALEASATRGLDRAAILEPSAGRMSRKEDRLARRASPFEIPRVSSRRQRASPKRPKARRRIEECCWQAPSEGHWPASRSSLG
jgi:hypothetical protein